MKTIFEQGKCWIVQTRRTVRTRSERELDSMGIDPESPQAVEWIGGYVDVGACAPLQLIAPNTTYGGTYVIDANDGSWTFDEDPDEFLAQYVAWLSRHEALTMEPVPVVIAKRDEATV